MKEKLVVVVSNLPGQFPMIVVNDYFNKLGEYIVKMVEDVDKAMNHNLGRVLKRFDSQGATNRLDELDKDIQQIIKDYHNPKVYVKDKDLSRMDKALESKFRQVYGDGASEDLDKILQGLRDNHEISEKDAKKIAKGVASSTRNFSVKQVDKQVEKITGVRPHLSMPALSEKMGIFTQENVRLIKSVPTKYHDEIAWNVREAALTGMSNQELTKHIDKAARKTTDNAKLIARDQVGKFFGQTTKARHGQLGFKRFEWRIVGDDRVRDSHEPLNGNIYTWETGADGLFPGMDIQCRCIALPVPEEVLGEEVGVQEVSPPISKSPAKRSVKKIDKTAKELSAHKEIMDEIIEPDDAKGWFAKGRVLSEEHLIDSDRYAVSMAGHPDTPIESIFANAMRRKTGLPADEYAKMVRVSTIEDLIGIAKDNGAWLDMKKQIVNNNVEFAGKIIQKWNSTSAGDPKALFIQESARKEFNIQNSFTNHFNVAQLNTGVERYGQYEDAYRAVLRASYDQTQSVLAREGINSVTLYRGVSFSDAHLPKGITHFDFKQMTKEVGDIATQPISSFSTNPEKVGFFLGAKDKDIVMAAEVPVERIVGMGSTGLGTSFEKEAVVMGGLDSWECIPIQTSFPGNSFIFNILGK